MTICDVWTTRDRVVALCDTDTVVKTETGTEYRDVSKVFAVPHLPAIVAGAGYGRVLWKVAAFAVHSEMTTEAINGLARAVYSVVPPTDEIDRGEIVFAGWDDRAKRMAMRAWSQESRETGFLEREPLAAFVGPWEEGRPPPPMPKDDHGFIALGLEQVEIQRRLCGPESAGRGKLILTQVDRRGAHMRVIAALPDFLRLLAAARHQAGSTIPGQGVDFGHKGTYT